MKSFRHRRSAPTRGLLTTGAPGGPGGCSLWGIIMKRSILLVAMLLVGGLITAHLWWPPREKPLTPPKAPNPHFFNERAFPHGKIPL